MGASATRLGHDEVVLITGCSVGGIGHALAREFAAQGCHVFATARTTAAIGNLSDSGIHCLTLDVTDNDSIQAVLKEVLHIAGRIDVLVNNAGMGYSAPVAEVKLEKVRQLYETNVFGAMAMVQAVFPHMVNQRKGRIVNIGSVAAYVHRPWNAPYCSSKAALHAISDCMRIEMSPFNVKVVLVTPGFIRTNIFRKNLESMALSSPDGHFRAYDESRKRMTAKSMSDPKITPVGVFAKRVVRISLAKKPRWRLVYGHQSMLALFASCLPTWLLDKVLHNMMCKS